MITKVVILGYRIFRDFTLKPLPGLNLVVGANDSGKSTLMEAITLALTGRINGRAASEDLNPYWFNTELVEKFVQQRGAGCPVAWPEISIELFLENRDDLQCLCGANNSESQTVALPGVVLRILPNQDYRGELEEWARSASPLLPVEYYKVDWRSFADAAITVRPRGLAAAVIDSRTIRSPSGIDYHLRSIINDALRPTERAAISVAYRKMKTDMAADALGGVNDRMAHLHASLHDQPICLAMDHSARASWESAVTPHVSSVPLSMSGQGQQAAIKIALAMNRHSESAAFVMVEEPENHLTHTSLTTLLSRMGKLAGVQQQLFVATHSSFVVNRLGLNGLHLLGGHAPRRLSQLRPDTVAYFQKLAGYDTLRVVLAEKIVLVEGPSDEMIFGRIFKDVHGVLPMERGIDVLSLGGLSSARWLELCAALDKTVAAICDNDGLDAEELRKQLKPWLAIGRRELFVGAKEYGETLEPQLIHFNGERSLRETLEVSDSVDLAKWMRREKTEAALRIATSARPIVPPAYMLEAVSFICGK